MWETSFQHSTSTPLPSNTSIETGLELLHDFAFVVHLSPNCRGCKPIPPPNTPVPAASSDNNMTYFEVEDDLPFIPKSLWSGGVTYRADFVPTRDGCEITVHAPGGFTSTNRWSLIRDDEVEEDKSKDMRHPDQTGGGWHVQIVSDAKVNRTFAGFVKAFMKRSHQQLQGEFVQRLRDTPTVKSSGMGVEMDGVMVEHLNMRRDRQQEGG